MSPHRSQNWWTMWETTFGRSFPLCVCTYTRSRGNFFLFRKTCKIPTELICAIKPSWQCSKIVIWREIKNRFWLEKHLVRNEPRNWVKNLSSANVLVVVFYFTRGPEEKSLFWLHWNGKWHEIYEQLSAFGKYAPHCVQMLLTLLLLSNARHIFSNDHFPINQFTSRMNERFMGIEGRKIIRIFTLAHLIDSTPACCSSLYTPTWRNGDWATNKRTLMFSNNSNNNGDHDRNACGWFWFSKR